MKSYRLVPFAALAACTLSLTACSSDASSSSAGATTTAAAAGASTAAATPAASGCPTVAPQTGGTPEWTFSGATGSVAVTGSTDSTAPSVVVTAPFSVNETVVKTLKPGSGPVVADSATVSVCYMGVNGRDATVFDSSYQRGAPVQFPLGGVVPGFQKAIAGQSVGSTVAVAVTSADGYPSGQPDAGINPGDSLIFAIKILDATS